MACCGSAADVALGGKGGTCHLLQMAPGLIEPTPGQSFGCVFVCNGAGAGGGAGAEPRAADAPLWRRLSGGGRGAAAVPLAAAQRPSEECGSPIYWRLRGRGASRRSIAMAAEGPGASPAPRAPVSPQGLEGAAPPQHVRRDGCSIPLRSCIPLFRQ